MRGNPKEDMYKKEPLDHWDKSHSWHPLQPDDAIFSGL